MSNPARQLVEKLRNYCNILRDDAREESAKLPAPEIIAADIAADLEAAMEQFATIAEDLKK